jgi:hypothetical protein
MKHNNRMQPDFFARCARKKAADAGRYASSQLTIISQT